MATFTQQITLTANDVQQINSTGFSAAGSIIAGYDTSAAELDRFGLRWTGVTIPNTATIVSATLTLTQNGARSGLNGYGSIFFDANDNAPAFSSSSLPSGITPTTNSVLVPSGSANQVFVLDVSAAIQEVLGRSGWVSGNAIRCASLNPNTNSTRQVSFFTVDTDATKAATLTINYNVSGSVGTASGSSTVLGIGAALVLAVGTASGSSNVQGFSTNAPIGVGTATGTSSVVGVGMSTVRGAGSAAGTSSVQGYGIAAAVVSAVGTATGSSSAVAIGAASSLAYIFSTQPVHVFVGKVQTL